MDKLVSPSARDTGRSLVRAAAADGCQAWQKAVSGGGLDTNEGIKELNEPFTRTLSETQCKNRFYTHLEQKVYSLAFSTSFKTSFQ